jgi:RNA polymerase sigma factor (sigma-70 family)
VRARREFQRARERFVNANLRLVVTFASRHGRSVAPLADRIQEGNIGLMKAVDRFDPSRGVKFSTYAAWWIRHSITRAVQSVGRTVRVPTQVQQLLARAERERRRIVQETGREPDLRELAARIDVDPERLEWARSAMEQRSVSLDSADDDCDIRMVDAIGDESSLEALEAVVERRDRSHALAALGELPMRERDILHHRFDLPGAPSLTFTQLGERHGISRERARQLTREAIAQLRRALLPDAPRARCRPSAFAR